MARSDYILQLVRLKVAKCQPFYTFIMVVPIGEFTENKLLFTHIYRVALAYSVLAIHALWRCGLVCVICHFCSVICYANSLVFTCLVN